MSKPVGPEPSAAGMKLPAHSPATNSASASASTVSTTSASTTSASTASVPTTSVSTNVATAGVSSSISSVSAASMASVASLASPCLRPWARTRLRSTRSRRAAVLLVAPRRRPAAVRLASRFWTTSRRMSSRRSTTMVMWQVRLLMRVPRPRARAANRRRVGPSSAKQALTNSSSGSWPSLCWALATALASTLRTVVAIPLSVNCSTSSARFTGRSRMMLSTRRALLAELRTYKAEALVPPFEPATKFFSLSFGPVISGDPSRSSPGRRGT